MGARRCPAMSEGAFAADNRPRRGWARAPTQRFGEKKGNQPKLLDRRGEWRRTFRNRTPRVTRTRWPRSFTRVLGVFYRPDLAMLTRPARGPVALARVTGFEPAITALTGR